MACFKDGTIIDLTTRESLALPDFRGTTLRVTRGTVWITQEHDTQDIVLRAGDTWVVERNGLTLLEAQEDSTFCVLGRALATWMAPRPARRVAGGARVAARVRGRGALSRGAAAGARPVCVGALRVEGRRGARGPSPPRAIAETTPPASTSAARRSRSWS